MWNVVEHLVGVVDTDLGRHRVDGGRGCGNEQDLAELRQQLHGELGCRAKVDAHVLLYHRSNAGKLCLHLVDTRFQTRKPEVSALVRLGREIRCDERRAVDCDHRSHHRFTSQIHDPASEGSGQALRFSTFRSHYCQ